MSERLHGRQAVREALRAGRRQPIRLLLAQGIRETDLIAEIVSRASAAGCPVEWVERRELNRLGVKHQGVALEASPYPYSDLEAILALAEQRAEEPLVVMLDHLEDPRNVGALLRTAESAGVHGVLLPTRRAAAITPAACETSAGAVEHLLVARVTNLKPDLRRSPTTASISAARWCWRWAARGRGSAGWCGSVATGCCACPCGGTWAR